MSDRLLEKLDKEWARSLKSEDYPALGKILRSKINVLKAGQTLSEHRKSLQEWVDTLEKALEQIELKAALAVIGHLRYARKSLSWSNDELGSAFRNELSQAERAKFKRRNAPPRLGLPDRASLPEGYANGSPSEYLQPGVLGSRQK